MKNCHKARRMGAPVPYDKGTEAKKPMSFLLVPSSSKLATLSHLWIDYSSREAAEDAQDEFADRGLNYDIVEVKG